MQKITFIFCITSLYVISLFDCNCKKVKITTPKKIKIPQAKKARVIPDEFNIELGDLPRWLHRHAYNVSINGGLKTDKERVPSELYFNRSMLPNDLYVQVYLQKWKLPPIPETKTMPPRNLSAMEQRATMYEECFGPERPFDWIERGWNFSCVVCGLENAYYLEHMMHVAGHYVTNCSATPKINWTGVEIYHEQMKKKAEQEAVDYAWDVHRGKVTPTPEPGELVWRGSMRCYECTAYFENETLYDAHIQIHIDHENEWIRNLTTDYPPNTRTKSWDDIHFRKIYVKDTLNTQEEDEYSEAQKILKEASHSLNTDEIMERTQNLSINKRLLDFAVDSEGNTCVFPRLKEMPDMSPWNDSEMVGDRSVDTGIDPGVENFNAERRKKWEEEWQRRGKAQEKDNPLFATYSLDSNETSNETINRNVTRRRRKYTPNILYIRKRRSNTYKPSLVGKKKLRRVNTNIRKKKEVVYKQQLNKIIQQAKKYMKKYNETKYPSTQPLYEKVKIYKIKEKFLQLGWFVQGLDKYTLPDNIGDINLITNTPHTTVRPLFYKRLKRDIGPKNKKVEREKRDINQEIRDDEDTFKMYDKNIDTLKRIVRSIVDIDKDIMNSNDDISCTKKHPGEQQNNMNNMDAQLSLDPVEGGGGRKMKRRNVDADPDDEEDEDHNIKRRNVDVVDSEERKHNHERKKRNIEFDDLTMELKARREMNDWSDHGPYLWDINQSWEYRIKNVNIRNIMFEIMAKRLSSTTIPPAAYVKDFFDHSHEQFDEPSRNSLDARVKQFYDDHGEFSGRTKKDLEFYFESAIINRDVHEVGPAHDPRDSYHYMPKEEDMKYSYQPYTNVKPGSRKNVTFDEYLNYFQFTDKKDYYDSSIEVAKSQARWPRDVDENRVRIRKEELRVERKARLREAEKAESNKRIRGKRGVSLNGDQSKVRRKRNADDNSFNKNNTKRTFWIENWADQEFTGAYSMEKSKDISSQSYAKRKRRDIEWDEDTSSYQHQFHHVNGSQYDSLFYRVYPNLSVYTPYTFYPTTLKWQSFETDPTQDLWVERNGTDSGDLLEMDSGENPLLRSVKDYLESQWVSREMLKKKLHPENDSSYDPDESRLWYEWNRNASREDENTYVFPKFTCTFSPHCTFNESHEELVDDHLFIHHYTYPVDYLKRYTMRDIEQTELGWEKLTHVDYLLHKYSDENEHDRIISDFDTFTGFFDHHSFPTVHPMFTRPSKKRRWTMRPSTSPSHVKHDEKLKTKHLKDSEHTRHKKHKREVTTLPNTLLSKISRRVTKSFLSRSQSIEYTDEFTEPYQDPNTPSWMFSNTEEEEAKLPPKLRCKYCGDEFRKALDLISHKSSVHPRKRTPTTTPCIRFIKKFFTLDSEVDLSKNYDMVFSEPDKGSFVQHRPIVEDDEYMSFNSNDSMHQVNPESYQKIDDYFDLVFNKTSSFICNACGKNVSDDRAEAHYRKHVSNIKKDYFDELPPEYMDRCLKEAHWNKSWETIHHELKRQHEVLKIQDNSMIEQNVYKCKKCNITFKDHDKTFKHMMEHKKNATKEMARQAEIRTQLRKQQKLQNETKHNKMHEPIKGKREKRSVDCLIIEDSYPNNTKISFRVFEHKDRNNTDELTSRTNETEEEIHGIIENNELVDVDGTPQHTVNDDNSKRDALIKSEERKMNFKNDKTIRKQLQNKVEKEYLNKLNDLVMDQDNAVSKNSDVKQNDAGIQIEENNGVSDDNIINIINSSENNSDDSNESDTTDSKDEYSNMGTFRNDPDVNVNNNDAQIQSRETRKRRKLGNIANQDNENNLKVKKKLRKKRQIKIDVNNNNTIKKINWEFLAKALIEENRNLSNIIDKHVTKRTTMIRKYECRRCGDRFPDLQPYVEHITMHEKEDMLDKEYSEEFNITCDHCYQIFSTEDAIHEHNMERLRVIKEKEAQDYAELNRTTRCKIYTPFENPFTIPILENQDNTFWNPPEPTYTDDPDEDKYYCHYCKDLMINTKEMADHEKWHETYRKEAKEKYLKEKAERDARLKKQFSIEGSVML